MLAIILLIFLGVISAYVFDKLYLQDRFNRISLPADDEVVVLDRERLSMMLDKSELYGNLKRTHEIHRSRLMSRTADRRHHLAQARNRGGGQGVLPEGE